MFIQEQLVTVIVNIIKHWPEGVRPVTYAAMDLIFRIFDNVSCDSELIKESSNDLVLKTALERTVIKAVMVTSHLLQHKEVASYFMKNGGLVKISLISNDFISDAIRYAIILSTKVNNSKSNNLSKSSLESLV